MTRKPEPMSRPAARPIPHLESWLSRSKDVTFPMRTAFNRLAAAFDAYDIPPYLWQQLSTAYSDMLRHVLAQQGLAGEPARAKSPGPKTLLPQRGRNTPKPLG